MPLETYLSDIQEKKELAQQMARWYYKGFGSSMEGILCNMEGYVQNPEMLNYSEIVYRLLNRVGEFYSKIPFGDFHGKEQFYPLFIVKSLLPFLHHSLDTTFNERTEENFRVLDVRIQAIVEVGRLYDESLRSVLKEIRLLPEGKDFQVQVIDDRGKVWSF